MAISTNLIDYATDTTANGTTANASVQPSDNCHTIVILNTDGSNSALVGIVDTGTDLTSANSATIIAGASLSLKIGTSQFRPCGSLNNTGGSAGPQVLRHEGIGGTPVISFQFLNSTLPVAP